MGQHSKYSGMLRLNTSNAGHCLSDFEKILESQGANRNLQKICSIDPAKLTEASCPVVDVNKFESIVDSSRLLAACGKVDPVNECCHQVCQNAIQDAATKIAMNGMSNMPENSTRIDDCKNIVFRWLASKLDTSSANGVLRGLSNCKVNKVCPLVFPGMINVTRECRDIISNKTSCCKAMESYVSHLQEQSFITNLQALNCAASLGMKLQKANVSHNVYNLCRINLKDFSLQVGSQDSGCLLPSLPSDVSYDKTSGIGFICDLNDNIEAPWPSSSSFVPAGSCNETAKLPALPAATSSSQRGLHTKKLACPLLFSCLLILTNFI
ncbi:GPI-anchored protein [Melia azedarach]|nr:GPI-anchored protein [Melia azedarach]